MTDVDRMTAEERATILVAQRREVGRAHAQRPARVPAVGHQAATDEHVERRAAAFRTMAGVRVQAMPHGRTDDEDREGNR